MWNSIAPSIEKPESEIVEPDLEESSSNFYKAISISGVKTLVSFRDPLEFDVPKGNITIYRRLNDSSLGLVHECGKIVFGADQDSYYEGEDHPNKNSKNSLNNNSNSTYRNNDAEDSAKLLNSKHIHIKTLANISCKKSRTKFKHDQRNRMLSENFEIVISPSIYISDPIVVFIDEVLFRWKSWEIEAKHPFQKLDDSSIRFRAMVKPNADTVIAYSVVYRL